MTRLTSDPIDQRGWKPWDDTLPDHHTREGAQALCKRLEAYWAERGMGKVDIHMQMSDGFAQPMRQCYYLVRSTLINGLPREEYLRRRDMWRRRGLG